MPVQTATVPGNALPADTPQQASIPRLQGRNPRAGAQSGAADQSKTLNDPVLTARTDSVKSYFTVSGKVSTPSKYDLHGDTTVAECIAIGFTVAAKHSQVSLFQRKNFDWVEVHKVNVKRMLHSHDLAEDNRSASAPLADNIL